MDGEVEIKEEPTWEDEEEDEDDANLQPPLEVYLKTEFCEEHESQQPGSDLQGGVNSRHVGSFSPVDDSESDDADICQIQPDVLIHTPDEDPLEFPSPPSDPSDPGEADSDQEPDPAKIDGKTEGEDEASPASGEKGSDSQELAARSPMSIRNVGHYISKVQVVDKLEKDIKTEDGVPESVVMSDQGGAQIENDVKEDAQGNVTIQGNTKYRFVCKICGKSSSWSSNLTKHIRRHFKANRLNRPLSAPAEKKFKCDLCEKMFSSSSNRNQHRLIHSKVKEPKKVASNGFKCDFCQKEFACSSNRKRHLRVHTGEKPVKVEGVSKRYLCDICGKELTTASNLRAHRLRHSGIRPEHNKPPGSFRCDVCGKELSSGMNLRLHAMLHEGTRPHRCPTCGASFAKKDHFTRHMKTHTGEKTFVCQICGWKFIQSAHLVSHMRSHRGERPFACDVCGRSFAQRSHLKYHKRARHAKV